MMKSDTFWSGFKLQAYLPLAKNKQIKNRLKPARKELNNLKAYEEF